MIGWALTSLDKKLQSILLPWHHVGSALLLFLTQMYHQKRLSYACKSFLSSRKWSARALFLNKFLKERGSSWKIVFISSLDCLSTWTQSVGGRNSYYFSSFEHSQDPSPLWLTKSSWNILYLTPLSSSSQHRWNMPVDYRGRRRTTVIYDWIFITIFPVSSMLPGTE